MCPYLFSTCIYAFFLNISGAGKGRIICGDIGPRRIQEVDLIEKGADFGWNNWEGSDRKCYSCGQGTCRDTI